METKSAWPKQLIFQKNYVLKTGFILVFLLYNSGFLFAQGNFCNFDESLEQMMFEHPEMYQIFMDNETEMQDMMEGNPEAIMNE